MVLFAKTHGIRATARRFYCSRNTVRGWLQRFKQKGRSGLKDFSRAPKSCPHKTSLEIEQKILQARNRIPCYGPLRLKDNFNLPCSLGAIARILRQKKKVRKRRKKAQKKNDLRVKKAKYPSLSFFQMDIKYLNDIPHYWPQMKHLGLPRKQYTIRDVKSGATFVSYSNQVSMADACWALKRLFNHLENNGIDTSKCVVQTDNGAEFGGGSTRNKRDRGFTHLVEELLQAQHRFIPPATPNANADVESFHNTIEEEFFNLENFSSREDFFQRVTTYQHHYNLNRKNYSKRATPMEILIKDNINPSSLYLHPVDLETQYQVGQHLPVLPDFTTLF